ncbi:histidine triad protein HinT [Mycoplasmopsis glycophila]|uniref:Histidine triad nucleotide-binding (HIT-like) protein n=1 Tax=Mycoplasmopsis glycophila TaxID=171285 RepID=A0A449AU87_9BACT|nr:HIT domain-containing protein [Mycoplasmopsis glycophila]VEU70067.1 histidine triad nucleotide-binding (HIT-like) protein [Mycoplasmopsis glycophila]
MNIFQKIINKEIPAKFLYEDDKVIAIYDIAPKQPGHFLIIPKEVGANILENSQETIAYTFLKARELAANLMREDSSVKGFKIHINTGSAAGQEVMHTHIHVIPYR